MLPITQTNLARQPRTRNDNLNSLPFVRRDCCLTDAKLNVRRCNIVIQHGHIHKPSLTQTTGRTADIYDNVAESLTDGVVCDLRTAKHLMLPQSACTARTHATQSVCDKSARLLCVCQKLSCISNHSAGEQLDSHAANLPEAEEWLSMTTNSAPDQKLDSRAAPTARG